MYVYGVDVVHAVHTSAQAYEGQSRMPETFSHSLTYCPETGHKLSISASLSSS